MVTCGRVALDTETRDIISFDSFRENPPKSRVITFFLSSFSSQIHVNTIAILAPPSRVVSLRPEDRSAEVVVHYAYTPTTAVLMSIILYIKIIIFQYLDRRQKNVSRDRFYGPNEKKI